jgi:putative endonuclease
MNSKHDHYSAGVYISHMLFRCFVYITTNENKTTLYIGVTNNIQNRLGQHYADSMGKRKSFAGRYNCYYLIYYEGFNSIDDAIYREKEIKKWRREKKICLIEELNPEWEFLNNQVV